MQLELNDVELSILREALQARVQNLRDELAHTDQRDLRAALRGTLDRTEAVLRRVDAAAAGPPLGLHV